MYQKVCCTCKAVVLILAAVVVTVSRSPRCYSPFVLICSNIAFSLTWPASMQVHWNKRKRLHKKRVRLPQDWFGTPTWPPFHCLGTPIWPPWRHVKTLYRAREKSFRHVAMEPKFLDLNKPWLCKYCRKKKKLTSTTFLCMIALRNKTIAHNFIP